MWHLSPKDQCLPHHFAANQCTFNVNMNRNQAFCIALVIFLLQSISIQQQQMVAFFILYMRWINFSYQAMFTTRESFFIAVNDRWWHFGSRFPLFKGNFEISTSSTHTIRRLLIFSEIWKFLLSRKSRGRIWTCRVLTDFDPYVNKTSQKFLMCDPALIYSVWDICDSDRQTEWV